MDATFLFADIAGFTALTEAHGDEEAATLAADFCCRGQGRAARRDGGAREEHRRRADAADRRPRQAVLLGLRIVGGLMRDHGAPAVRVGLHHGPPSSATATTSARR